MMRGTLLNKLWALFLFVLTVAGTMVTGVTSIQVLPCCCDMYALIGMTSVTAVCASRLFSQSLHRAFVCGAVTPPVTSGVSAVLYVLYVPLPRDVPDYFGNDMPAALLDGIFAAVIAFPIGCLSAACCVGILRVRDGFRRGDSCHLS